MTYVIFSFCLNIAKCIYKQNVFFDIMFSVVFSKYITLNTLDQRRICITIMGCDKKMCLCILKIKCNTNIPLITYIRNAFIFKSDFRIFY